MPPGYIYCISNPHMPGLVKIGMTTRTPTERLKEANASGTWCIPDFKIEFAKKVSDAHQKEKTLHTLLEQYTTRAHSRREWFHVSIEQVMTFFDLIDGEMWTNKHISKTDDNIVINMESEPSGNSTQPSRNVSSTERPLVSPPNPSPEIKIPKFIKSWDDRELERRFKHVGIPAAKVTKDNRRTLEQQYTKALTQKYLEEAAEVEALAILEDEDESEAEAVAEALTILEDEDESEAEAEADINLESWLVAASYTISKLYNTESIAKKSKLRVPAFVKSYKDCQLMNLFENYNIPDAKINKLNRQKFDQLYTLAITQKFLNDQEKAETLAISKGYGYENWLVQYYFQQTSRLRKEIGANVVVLLQIGNFFTIYGKQNDEDERFSPIHSVSRICALRIKTHKGERDLCEAGIPTNALEKYQELLMDSDWDPICYREVEVARGQTIWHWY